MIYQTVVINGLYFSLEFKNLINIVHTTINNMYVTIVTNLEYIEFYFRLNQVYLSFLTFITIIHVYLHYAL